MKKIGRILDETLISNSESTSLGYYGMQGGTLVDNNTYVFISNHHDNTGSYADETSLIRKVSLSTGNILSEKIITVGHGNGLAYDKVNEVYYVACAHGNVTSNLYGYKIIKLDSDFEEIETITTEINFDSLCFDEENNLYAGVTYKGDLSNAMKIFKIDTSDFSIIDTITLNDIDTVGTGQDFCIYNNLIYFLQTEPNSILTFNMDGDCIMTNILRNGNVSYVGETENINSLGNGKFIIGTRYQPTGNLYDISQVFEINTLINEVDETNINRESLRWNLRSVYVDNTITKWNPDGSINNPYGCIDEVINLNYKQPMIIYLQNGSTYNVARINSFNGEIYTTSDAKIYCGDNYENIIIRESQIYFNSIKEISSINAQINSNIKLYSCTLKPSNDSELIYIDKHSIVELEGCRFDVSDDLTNALFNNNHGILRWNKGNTDLTNLDGITKFFKGSVQAIVPIHLFHGTVAKGETINLNNNNFTSFKMLEIDFNDSVKMFMQTRSGTSNMMFGNLSTGGTGNNVIKNVNINISANGLSFPKANSISFNANGEMSVNTTPDIVINDIFAY